MKGQINSTIRIGIVPENSLECLQMDLHLGLLNANASLQNLQKLRELSAVETALLHYSELYLGAAK